MRVLFADLWRRVDGVKDVEGKVQLFRCRSQYRKR